MLIIAFYALFGSIFVYFAVIIIFWTKEFKKSKDKANNALERRKIKAEKKRTRRIKVNIN